MNKFLVAAVLFFSAVFFISCQSKEKKLLTKKWDCVQVENLEPLGRKIKSREDSLVAMRMTAALKNLQWQFKSNNTYQCSTGSAVTASGDYDFTLDKKSIVCKSTTGNVAIYDIVALTEDELILKNLMESVNIVLHFRANSSDN